MSDFLRNACSCENADLPDYLGAPCQLLTQIERAHANYEQPIPSTPWVVIAAAMKGAIFYEQ